MKRQQINFRIDPRIKKIAKKAAVDSGRSFRQFLEDALLMEVARMQAEEGKS